MTEVALLLVCLAAYATAAVLDLRRLVRAGILCSLAGVACYVGFVVLRYLSRGVLPFASRAEAMMLFALSIQAAGLLVYWGERRTGLKAGTSILSTLVLVAGLILFKPGTGRELNPALNSPFFVLHILSAFAGYGALAAGLVTSVVALFASDQKGYRTISHRLGLATLLFLGLGILTGAVWADNCWGRFWGWDPKETGALFTWTIVLIFVHLFRLRPSRGLAAFFFVLATAAMLFTFIGVNLLPFGLHRYG